jgi:hypothetical protein
VGDALFTRAEEAFGRKGLADMVNLIRAYQAVCGILNCF